MTQFRWFAVVLLLSSSRLAAEQMDRADRSPRSVVVRVQSYVDVPSWELQSAIAQATRALRASGIEPEWRQLTPGAGVSTQDGGFVLVLLSPEMTERKCTLEGIAATVLGTAGPATGRAWIFADRIASVANQRGLATSDILGQVITHELGHLLLGSEAHGSGVMQDHVRLTGAVDARFTADQARRIRGRLHDRP